MLKKRKQIFLKSGKSRQTHYYTQQFDKLRKAINARVSAGNGNIKNAIAKVTMSVKEAMVIATQACSKKEENV